MRKIAIFIAALLIFAVSAAEKRPKYLFLLIGDGMGPNIVKLYRQQMGKTNFDRMGTPIETGTNNVHNRTTDSAASGTALACGIKTYNGAIGVNKDGTPVMSLAKILQKRGMKIGIISSVAITDATPSTHYANRLTRRDHAGILADMFVSGFDFFGVSSFLKPADLKDDLLNFMFKRNGYTVMKNKELKELKKGDKNVYIASTRAKAKSPATLQQVTEKAIELLDNPNGFFIMVEGGAIDGYNHRNEAPVMIQEMIEFDKTIGAVLNFAEKHPEDTLVVVTADHDTGGIQITGDVPVGFWKKPAKSYSSIEKEIIKMRAGKAPKDEIIKYVCDNTAITVPTGKAAQTISDAADRFLAGKLTEKGSMYGKYNPLLIAVFRERDKQNNYHYTTFGHTPTKVLTYSVGNGKKYFTAPLENSDVPRRISMAASGEDLLEKYKAVRPFPNVPDTAHFTIQSVSKNDIVCRLNLGEAKKLELSLSGGKTGKKVTVTEPFARVTFDKLSPDTEYTITAGDQSFKVRTLPELKNVMVRGAVISDPHTSVLPDNPRARLHSRSGKMLADARKFLDAQKIDVLLVPGDVTDRSFASEIKLFRKAFDKTSYKVITTPGNHDKVNKENQKEFTRFFKKPASYYDINGVQFITLDTANGKLNNPGNAEVIEKLDINRPAVIQTHYQLKKSNIIIKDKNAAVSFGNTDEDKKMSAKMIDKITKSRAIVLVGHKNSAEKITLGGNVVQLNCPQTTQYPCGYLMFEANNEGIALWFVPSAEIAVEEYSRRLASHSDREKYALPYWNAFYKW